jgi:hypothetical protein
MPFDAEGPAFAFRSNRIVFLFMEESSAMNTTYLTSLGAYYQRVSHCAPYAFLSWDSTAWTGRPVRKAIDISGQKFPSSSHRDRNGLFSVFDQITASTENDFESHTPKIFWFFLDSEEESTSAFQNLGMALVPCLLNRLLSAKVCKTRSIFAWWWCLLELYIQISELICSHG